MYEAPGNRQEKSILHCSMRSAPCTRIASRGAAGEEGSTDRIHLNIWRSFHSRTSSRSVPARPADLGYIEGKNILVEYRYAEGKPDRFLSLVRELVQLKLDVLVLPALQSIREAKQATKT